MIAPVQDREEPQKSPGDVLQPKAKEMNMRSMKEKNDDSHLVEMSGTNFPPHREVPERRIAAQADAVLTHEEVLDILDLTFSCSWFTDILRKLVSLILKRSTRKDIIL